MKVCKDCRIEKPREEFSRRVRNNDGLNGQCKSCERAYGKKYRKGYRRKQDDSRNVDSSHIDMKGIRKLSWCQTYEILSKIGYDVTKDIHEQFVNKYGLSYKQRPIRNIATFTPEDCLDTTDETNLFTY